MDTGVIIPPPIPWIARLTTIMSGVNDAAARTDPTAKKSTPRYKTGLRPNWSEILPAMGMNTVSVRRKAAVSQE